MSIQDLARAAGISAEDEELLALLLAEEGVELAVADGIPRRPGRAEAPLSFAQERLWFLDRLTPGSATYNIPAAVRLSGILRLEVFARCWREILRRHDSLRTRFETRDGIPVQVIDRQPTAGSELVLVDLSTLPEEARRRAENALVHADAARPFDLERGPVARATLLRQTAGEHVLLLTLHHIVSDGWSMGILVREVAALYDAFVRNRPSPLPEPEIQYADFAEWQRTSLTGEALEAELSYWRERLSGAPVLALLADRPRPAVPSARGASLALRPRPAVAAALRELTERRGATMFMTLLAALSVLLARYTGQEDVVLGSMIANRTRAEVEGLIGFFVNALALRADLSGDPPFSVLVDRVREISLGAFAHQDLPFEKLVAEVQPDRDLSRSPLFQIVFLLQNTPSAALELPGLTLRPVDMETRSAKFDLQVTAVEDQDGFTCSFNYSTDLFDGVTIARLAEHFVTLLGGIAADPERPISRLPAIPAAERQQVLREWNETGDVPERGSGLHDLFAAQAARIPEATAIVDGQRRWSYGELDAGSNRLARHLRGLGVGPESRVGLCLARSGRMVAAMLAVQKAGGAYVGLDPRYPKDRLAFMLADAAAVVLLTEEEQLAALPEHSVPVVLLDDESFLEGESSAALSQAPGDGRSAGPGNLAYLIYTSGSTGRPKGVAIEHASAAALVAWAGEVFPASALAGVLAATSICFDLSVFEIFVPLAWGGTVILAENALALPTLPAAGEVTLVNTVPSAIAGLVRGGTLPPRAAIVNLAGEALKRELVEEIYRQPGVRQVLNLYGPSEDTTYSTWTAVPSGSERPPAIGRPIAGTRSYLLDARLEPVPLGAPGELYLAGAGLARGYLGRPELTAERFVPDPFASSRGERLYRTGDLARYLPDGVLDYLGRIDHQVKIRGFRIELGEIEAALLASPGVRDAVVLVREEGGDRRLVGYLVPAHQDQKEALAAADLRVALGSVLPEYMIPAAFVFLDALPVTPNGKVDRRALERIAPELPGSGATGAYAAPEGPLEELLAEVWGDLLRVERIGRDVSFFDLGGHSLLATQVVSRVRQALGVELPLRRIFEARTIARLAACLAAEHPEAAAWVADGTVALATSAPIPTRPWQPGDSAPLSYAQERLWFLDQLDPGSAAYNIPLALRLTGHLDVPALAASLTEIARRHATLRTRFALLAGASEERPIQVIGPPAGLALPLADLAGLPEAAREAEAHRLAREEARRPFDLGKGPVLRAALLRLRRVPGEEEHAALLDVHHIASDGWSTGVLVREIAALYTAFAAGRPSPLPELPIQYADFAAWQREWLTGEVLAAQIDYWRRTLTGVPALQLPTDRPRPAVASFRGASVPLDLPPSLGRDLEELGRTRGASLFMTLLAAFSALLARWSGQEDVTVGSPIANRTRAEVEGLIGFFVNTLVLRSDLSGTPSFGALLDRVREAALGAYAHQDLPFERVVEELHPERDLSRSPLFQVMLILQNAPSQELRLPGLTLGALPASGGAAKFDLTLGVGLGPHGLVGGLEYAADLFDPATAERLLGHFRTLLAAAVDEPGLPVWQLPLMPEPERRQVLVEWNETGSLAIGSVAALGLHELFMAQAARTPGETALVDGERRLTYGELDAESNRLARHLRSLGVGPEARVGICAERSARMVVAMLGVLKAGGAYVGLDPRYPQDRLAFMLEDAAAAVLLTEGGLLALLPEHRARVVRLDDESLLAGESDAPLKKEAGRAAGPGNLAYLIYTSGSTG
ncbi:MAG: hypothetical protein QOJ16_2646, partial [Acidobacteriota bacterium]|nr:hypothetical protein [Acidobacteriota bacterium]